MAVCYNIVASIQQKQTTRESFILKDLRGQQEAAGTERDAQKGKTNYSLVNWD